MIRSTAKGDRTYVCSHCKQCKYERNKIWREANRDKYKHHMREAQRRKRAGIKRKPRKRWEEKIAYHKKYIEERRKKDPNFKLGFTLRGRLLHALKRNTKSARTLELLGTTVEHLRQHLEAQFLPGMNKSRTR